MELDSQKVIEQLVSKIASLEYQNTLLQVQLEQILAEEAAEPVEVTE